MAALATVIQHPIGFVYSPVNGLCNLVFRMLTCTMKRLRVAGKLTCETLYILWTRTLATETGNQLRSPNHFVPLLRVHSDSPIVSPLEDDEVEASQPAVYPIVTSTPYVHVGHGAMSVDDVSSIVCVPANDIDEAPELPEVKMQTGDMVLYAS